MQTFKLIAHVVLIVLVVLPVFSSAATGTIDDTYKYAWSNYFGWINFKADSSNVVVSDSQLTGYAWGGSAGWINLALSGSVFVGNNGAGTLSGYAWGEGIGYINFSGVTIDSDGYFHGYATTDSGGQISFNCANTSSCASSDFKVRTSWRKTSSGGGGGSAGVGGGGGSISPPIATTSTPILSLATTTPMCTLVQPFYPFITRNLSYGAEDAQVVSLQKFLNTNSFILTHSGYGSYGKETLYFGSLTQVALKKFQEEYASRGVQSELGILGPKTRELINTFREVTRPPLPKEKLLCEPIRCAPYITSYIHQNHTNDEGEIRKLQDFLKKYEKYNIVASGVYDTPTYNAVHAFQTKHADDVLIPWGIASSTGYVYKTTSQKINDLYCFYMKGLVR